MVSAVFDENTVYGSREAVHPCLLVVSNDKGNYFLKSKAWRQGVVSHVSMLPRGEMLKVDRNAGFFGNNERLTKVQELKQACRFK